MYYKDKLNMKGEGSILLQPSSFNLEQSTIWSFPNRGKWATHSGEYRGNWSPYVPRNLILLYSKPGDWILDQFLGSGTTLVEAKLLHRNAVGVDINPQSIFLSEKNLNFKYDTKAKVFIKEGNAMNLSFIKDEKIDFICTHPPYADIIKYSNNIDGDISLLNKQEFQAAITEVAMESYRVLKKGKYCAVMMGDKREKGNVIPLGLISM